MKAPAIRQGRTGQAISRWAGMLCGAAFVLAACITGLCQAQEVTLSTSLNEQIVMVMSGSGATAGALETTIFKPPGAGPFPLVIMNHGKDPGDPHLQKRDRFVVLSREFVKRGYAVMVPMRKGFAKSSGEYADFGCNMADNGYLQADDLQIALDYAQRQSWVDKNRVVVAGQSYGGLAAVAFGTRRFSGVRGTINFAGGLRADGGDCQWQAALINAFANYGSKSTVPSLWFYGQNDSYFNPEMAARMHSAFVNAGGHARLVAYGPFKSDAHSMIGSRDGVKVWWPETEKFLRQIGMPADETVVLAEDTPIARSDFATIDNVAAIPYLKEKGREAYRAFLTKSLPRAFALSSSGSWSWAEDGDDPAERVLAYCQHSSKQPCKLYAVDDYVVWKESPVVTQNQALSSNQNLVSSTNN
jgi:dienelactone hydrolase